MRKSRCAYCGGKARGTAIAGRPAACSSHADLLRLEDRLYRNRPGEATGEAVQATRERRR